MSIGSLIVTIGADISGIRKDAAKGAESLGKVEGSAKTLGTALKVLAFGAVAKEITSMVRASMDAIDAEAKLSRQLGGTINGLKGLKLAASDAGVSAGALTSAAEMLNRRLGEAARMGSGQAHDALTTLGLDARDLSAMDLDQRMASIADAIEKAGLSSQGTAEILGRLGIRQGEFTRLLLDGGDALRAARQDIDALGLSLSEVDAAKVEAANDALARVKLASTAIGQQLAVNLSPVITAISNQFLDTARDTETLKSSVQSVVEYGVKGFGYLGDALKGIHIVFKTVELAGWGLGTALADVFAGTAKAIGFLVDLAIADVNKLITGLNKIPGVDITPIALMADSPLMKALGDFSANMHATTADVFQQLKALAEEEWPSDKATEFFAKIQAAAEAAATKVIESRAAITDFGGGGGEEAKDEAAEAEAKKLKDKLEAQLNVLREYVMSETQLEDSHYADRLAKLNAALEQELLSQREFASLSEGIDKKHMDALAKIRESGMEQVRDVTVSQALGAANQLANVLANSTATAARENKAMFEVHKAFAIASAVLAGAQGVAMSLGSAPFPIAIVMAATHAIAAAAQVATIMATQFQGGSRSVAAPSVRSGSTGGGSFGGGSSAAAGGAAGGVEGGASQLMQINLQGDTFSRNTVIALIEGINEAVSDGARIVVE